MKVDIFCQVIDFWGDVAVSWRFAQALKLLRPYWQLRYFCDNWAPWLQLMGLSNKPAYWQGVSLQDYEVEIVPGDLAVEFLACNLPSWYPKSGLVINIEYLTAEDWACSCHLKQSYPQHRFFFMPGFSAGTGGLVFGDFFQKQIAQENRVAARLAWATKMGLNLDPHQKWVSCYIYQLDFKSLAGSHDALFIGPKTTSNIEYPSVCVFIPMTLRDYDELLWLCDENLVRGEDSLSRAVLTGKPFLWQAYPQEDDAHHIKVEALLQQICPETESDRQLLTEHFFLLNTQNIFDWRGWQVAQSQLTDHFIQLKNKLLSRGSQESHFCQFIDQIL